MYLILWLEKTTIVRDESVMWSDGVIVSNQKPPAQLPLAVPSTDVQAARFVFLKVQLLNTNFHLTAPRPDWALRLRHVILRQLLTNPVNEV